MWVFCFRASLNRSGLRIGFVGIRTPNTLDNSSNLFIKVEGIQNIKREQSLICYSALLIHLSKGMTEMHFHVFSSLGILITLAQPIASIAALLTVAIHHLSFYFFLPMSLLNYEAGLPILAIHVVFALATGIPAIFISQKFKLYIVSVKNIIDEVQEIGISVANDSQMISEITKNISTSTINEAASVQQTTAAINELNSMIEKNSESAQSSAVGANQSLTQSSQGKDIVNEMVNSMSSIKLTNIDVTKAIQVSHEEMLKILNALKQVAIKTSVIDDIVFQTKLLSFNASVVAEEIGNLAQMSGVASKEISDMLKNNLSTIEGSISSTKASVQKIINESTQKIESGFLTAEQCKRVLQSIDDSITEIATMSNQISAASSEQSIGVNEISKAMGNIDTAIRENSQTANSATELAKSLKSNSEKLLGSVDKLIRAVA